ncbi:COQ9 family protein [Thalassospira sp.]|uniref:COQ9 family protein n=1 Tax=Thalassospira sp. TaxID=1912094 RepID=UPI0027325431|nr:COQ9 family protein [Thalassospira sp.]MDP2699829.1 COQ9 family protein [Thalassospira sp.]
MSVAESLARLEQQRDALVRAALDHIAFDGWSMMSLKAAAVDLGLAPEEVDRLLPGGVRQAIEHYVAMTDREMVAHLETLNLPDMKIRERIATAVRERLKLVEGHKDAVRAAVAWLALPQNLALSAKLTARTVDLMWVAAGDTATDYNRYTKRALLAGVYGSTLLYWLDDTSDDHRDTMAFLDRRIANVMKIPKIQAQIGKITERVSRLGGKAASCVPSPLRVFRQFGSPR